MFRSSSFLLVIATFGLLGARVLGDPEPQPPLVIQATPALAEFARDIVQPLRDEGIDVKTLKEAGNTEVIENLGTGQIDAALLTRPLKVEERVAYPEHHFTEFTLGTHALAVVVSRTVWEGGPRALKRDQIMAVYENKVRNWQDVGGERHPIQFFEPAHGRGPWEIFATWLYGDSRKAPGVPWQSVADGPDTRTALQFSSGGASVISMNWVDRTDVFPLAIINDAGQSIEPTVANIAAGTYPLVRPVIIAFADEPVTKKKKMVEFLLGEKGQEIVTNHDFVPQSALQKP